MNIQTRRKFIEITKRRIKPGSGSTALFLTTRTWTNPVTNLSSLITFLSLDRHIIHQFSNAAYLTIPVKMWMLVVKYNPTSLILQNREALLALFMGLEISCIVHLVMDYTPGLNRLR